MTDELRALADEWARELTTKRGLALLDIERFAAVLVDRARERIQSGIGEGVASNPRNLADNEPAGEP